MSRAAPDPWSRPPFWADRRRQDWARDRERFARLARLREELASLNPHSSVTRSIIERLRSEIADLEQALGLSPVRMVTPHTGEERLPDGDDDA